MLESVGLSRSYGSLKAVDDVSFSIGPGEIVGLLGHNGAGKSTLMKMLSGYLEPDCGSLRFRGVDPTVDPEAVQRSLGYLPESPPVYPEMQLIDYLDYVATLKGIGAPRRGEELRRVVRETDLEGHLFAPIATLSRGFQQRVGVAQAILGSPSLLILDEPTNGLDPAQTEQMRRLIASLAGSATVILSTHILQEVDAVCQRVLLLRRGRLALDARLDTLGGSAALRLDCSLDVSCARERLAGLDGVRDLSLETPPGENPGAFRYRLALDEDADLRKVSAAVARQVTLAEADLYRLQPEQFDLAALFRQADQEESEHGA